MNQNPITKMQEVAKLIKADMIYRAPTHPLTDKLVSSVTSNPNLSKRMRNFLNWAHGTYGFRALGEHPPTNRESALNILKYTNSAPVDENGRPSWEAPMRKVADGSQSKAFNNIVNSLVQAFMYRGNPNHPKFLTARKELMDSFHNAHNRQDRNSFYAMIEHGVLSGHKPMRVSTTGGRIKRIPTEEEFDRATAQQDMDKQRKNFPNGHIPPVQASVIERQAQGAYARLKTELKQKLLAGESKESVIAYRDRVMKEKLPYHNDHEQKRSTAFHVSGTNFTPASSSVGNVGTAELQGSLKTAQGKNIRAADRQSEYPLLTPGGISLEIDARKLIPSANSTEAKSKIHGFYPFLITKRDHPDGGHSFEVADQEHYREMLEGRGLTPEEIEKITRQKQLMPSRGTTGGQLIETQRMEGKQDTGQNGIPEFFNALAQLVGSGMVKREDGKHSLVGITKHHTTNSGLEYLRTDVRGGQFNLWRTQGHHLSRLVPDPNNPGEKMAGTPGPWRVGLRLNDHSSPILEQTDKPGEALDHDNLHLHIPDMPIDDFISGVGASKGKQPII